MSGMKKTVAVVMGAALLACAAVASVPVYARDLPEFTAMVEKNGPAVVNISTVQKVRNNFRGRLMLPPGFPSDLFRRFNGVPEGEDDDGAGMGPEQENQSLGSGFVISSDGYIVTNHHVIKDADEITVRLNDRRELPAKVMGSDERSDVAVLKVEAKDLPVVKIGSSEKLKVGEWVLAIGSPFGFDYSATSGIVSAKGRSLPNGTYVPFIQTDVAINPGNSGGPLFNMDGEVVGINSQIFSRTGGFMGLSFAIPVDVAMEVVEQIKGGGHVQRGWLGVAIQDVSRDLAESFGLSKPGGALVAQVLPDTPAEKAGLKAGDVILSFNGTEIGPSSELPQQVGRVHSGSKAVLQVMRDGKKQSIDVVIGALPEDGETVAEGSAGKDKPDMPRLGLAVTDLSAEQKKALKVEAGVVVVRLVPGRAADAGLRQGDVILSLGNTLIKDSKSFMEAVKAMPDKRSVPVRILRQGHAQFLVIKPEDKEKKDK